MKSRFLLACALALVAAAGFWGCGNKVEDYTSVVYIETKWDDTADIFWDVACGQAPALQHIVFESQFKGPVGDSTFYNVKLKDLIVTWRRIDGGTRLPPTFHGIYDVMVPAGGTAELNNAPLMRPEDLSAVPLNSLFPENGGLDLETKNTVIRMEATLTFYGEAVNGDNIRTFMNIEENFFWAGCTR